MKRVLVITYYFPPSGGSGVQRPLKFVKYLRDFGWEPIVLTVRDGAFPDRDESLAADVPAGVEVMRTRAADPYRLYARFTGRSADRAVTVGFLSDRPADWKERVSRWIRANLFLPDARVGWVPFATRAGRSLIRDRATSPQPVDAILSTGPPHSVHLIARRLHRSEGIPWVADFRDPWTGIDYYEQLPLSSRARRRDKRLERHVLAEASAVTVVTPSMRNELHAIVARSYEVITNGFDPPDLERALRTVSSAHPREKEGFRITHAGNMNEARNPEALWRALQTLRASGQIPHLRVNLVGNVDASVRDSVERCGLASLVDYVSYVPHDEAVAGMIASEMLLLVVNRVGESGAAGIVTGKLFEYIGANRPILGIGPVHGDAARILADSGRGMMFDYTDTDGVSRFIRDQYAAWDRGEGVVEPPPGNVERYTRRFQTGQFAEVLDRISAGTPSA